MVRYFLDTFPCLRLVAAEPRVGGPGLPGLGLSDEEREMVQRFDPTDASDSIGFFAARFEKVESIFIQGMQRSTHAGEGVQAQRIPSPVAKRRKQNKNS